MYETMYQYHRNPTSSRTCCAVVVCRATEISVHPRPILGDKRFTLLRFSNSQHQLIHRFDLSPSPCRTPVDRRNNNWTPKTPRLSPNTNRTSPMPRRSSPMSRRRGSGQGKRSRGVDCSGQATAHKSSSKSSTNRRRRDARCPRQGEDQKGINKGIVTASGRRKPPLFIFSARGEQPDKANGGKEQR